MAEGFGRPRLLGAAGGGVGQALLALAAAILLRLVSGPGPALPEPDDEGSASRHGDAEADGEGKVPPVTIRWSNISCTLSDKRGRVARFLLSNVNGEAKPGRLLAIMGPSGAGKTTLLNVLAGQLLASPLMQLSGRIDINGRPRRRGGFKAAYVRQDDLFFSQLTVRETLSLAAELQLPETLSVEDREQYVSKLLFRMGLD